MRAFTIPAIFMAVDRFSSPLARMRGGMDEFSTRAERMERSLRKISQKSRDVAVKSAMVGTAIVAPLVVAGKAAIDFEDKMADVAKTTGLSGTPLEKFGDSLLKLSITTRSTIPELLQIAEIGGQLGIAQKDLLSFVSASNKFGIALGKDFSGGIEQAVTQVGKIKTLFTDTRDLNISDAIIKTGSAINQLGAIGAATSGNITDFTLRIGALPDAFKPSLVNTLAMGTLFEEVGLTAEIAAGGVTKFLSEAGQNIGKFASQMKISSSEAKNLLANDPTEFMKKFALTFKGVRPDVLATKLKDLGLNSQEVQKVIGSLGSSIGRLTELQTASNTEFIKGTSLAQEAATKEATRAAMIQKTKNNLEALSITIGNEVLPMVSKLVDTILPYLKAAAEWVRNNKETTKIIVKVAAVVAGLLFTLSAFATVVSVVTGAMAAWGVVTKGLTAAQWLLNVALNANPIGLMIIGMTALAAIIPIIVAYWEDWGAALTMTVGIAALFFSPVIAGLAAVIMLVQSFSRNWNMIVQAFKSEGILGGIKAIGITILDTILYPIQQLLHLLGKIPGLGIAESLSAELNKFRGSMGINVGVNNSGGFGIGSIGSGVLNSTNAAIPQSANQNIFSSFINQTQETKPAIDAQSERQKNLLERIETTRNQNITMTVNDPKKRTSFSSEGDNIVMPVINSSFGFGR